MNEKIQRILTILIFLSTIVITIFVLFNNMDNFLLISLLSSILIAAFGIRILFIYPSQYRIIGKILLILYLFLIFYINYIDITNFSQIYFYLIVAEAVVCYFGKYGFIYIIIGYISLLVTSNFKYTRWNYFDFWSLFPGMIEISFYFVFVIGMIYIAGYQNNQSQKLSKTMSELEIKSKLLEETNRKLHETMKSLEEMTTLRERNRIAREIHDTVGHTLTTVSIEIEAGKRLISKNSDLARVKLDLAQEQVRKGLNDIRSSVRILKDGSDILAFLPSILALVKETEKHAGISVRSVFSPLPSLTAEQEKVLYSALQEGLTNGIRHGKSSEFVLKLTFVNNRVVLSLDDKGVGCGNITLGFGLTVMKERVEELGGNFNISSSEGNGCRLIIDIPVGEEIMDENDQDTYSG